MKPRFISVIQTLALVVCSATGSWAQGDLKSEPSSLGQLWRSTPGNEIRQSLHAGVGFSFSYDGKVMGPTDWTGWEVRQAGLTTTLRHPSGLKVVRTARVWSDFDAIEYTVVFSKEGKVELPALSEINAVDVRFNRPARGARYGKKQCGRLPKPEGPFSAGCRPMLYDQPAHPGCKDAVDFLCGRQGETDAAVPAIYLCAESGANRRPVCGHGLDRPGADNLQRRFAGAQAQD